VHDPETGSVYLRSKDVSRDETLTPPAERAGALARPLRRSPGQPLASVPNGKSGRRHSSGEAAGAVGPQGLAL